jgi:hypothetical protein
MWATCSAYLILDFTALKIAGECKLWSSSSSSFLHFPFNYFQFIWDFKIKIEKLRHQISSSSVALQSNADLRLLNGPLPVHSRLFRGHILGFLTVSFLQWQVICLSPNPQPGGPVHRIYNPRSRVAQLYPQALGTHFGRLLRPAWAAVGLFFSPVTTRGRCFS